jgi:hypothetical protein
LRGLNTGLKKEKVMADLFRLSFMGMSCLQEETMRRGIKRGLSFIALLSLAGMAGCGGPAGPVGPAGPPGAPGKISGYQIVMQRDVLAAGATVQVVVQCPTGKKVTGGGFSIETPVDVQLFASGPTDGHGNVSDHAWEVMARNGGSASRQVTSLAICISAE